MQRSEREIAEYMAYYNNTTDRKAALEALARVEGKTEEEIIAICEKHGVKLRKRKNAPLSEEKREEIRAALREGLSLSQAAERCGVSDSAVGRIRLELVDSGEYLPEHRGGRRETAKYKALHPEKTELNEQQAEQLADVIEKSEKEQSPNEQSPVEQLPNEHLPEAYPGQIYDDPQPIVEEDVKVFLPGEQEQKKGKRGTARERRNSGLWFAIRDQIADFLLGTFGAGTELISERVETEYERVVVCIRTADGKKVRCTLRTEGDDE